MTHSRDADAKLFTQFTGALKPLIEQKKFGWGVVGAGNVFEFKSGPALYKTANSELVAVMRTDAAKAEATAKRHGAKFWYTNPEINAIYIASPHYLHPEHVTLALHC